MRTVSTNGLCGKAHLRCTGTKAVKQGCCCG